MAAVVPAVAAVLPVAAAPGVRISKAARTAALEFIRQVYDHLPASKVFPNGGEIGNALQRLIDSHRSIANRAVVSRLLLLYKRCMDRDSLIVSACIDDRGDLESVIQIKLGDLNNLASDALERVARSELCSRGLGFKQFASAVQEIRTSAALLRKLYRMTGDLLLRYARGLAKFFAEKETQVAANERKLAILRVHIRDKERRRWSTSPPEQRRSEKLCGIKFSLTAGYQTDVITPLANAVRLRVPSCTAYGDNFAAEAVFDAVEEELFTLFCQALHGGRGETALATSYNLFPPRSRAAQTLYYIAGFICYKLAKASTRRRNGATGAVRDSMMHALFWSMECARHRSPCGGPADVDGAARAAVEAGVPQDLVDGVRHRRQVRAEANKLPAVFPTMRLYRFVTLLEVNFRNRITVGALCLNPSAIAVLERELLADPLVLQELGATLEAVTPAGRLASPPREDAVIARDLLYQCVEDGGEADADLVAAAEQAEAAATAEIAKNAGTHEPPAKRVAVAYRPPDFTIEERRRGAPGILSAVVRVFLNVCGRDAVRSVMSRRDVHTSEASVVSLRGSVAVVAQRLSKALEQLKGRRPGTQHQGEAGEPEAHHHAAGTGLDDDGWPPGAAMDDIDRAMAEVDTRWRR